MTGKIDVGHLATDALLERSVWLLAAPAAGKSWAKVSPGAGANKEKAPRLQGFFSSGGGI